jgi:hypothetical protein
MIEKKKKMGRPPLKDKDKRAKIVTLRLKNSERKELGQDAKSKGLSISDYLMFCWQKTRTEK